LQALITIWAASTFLGPVRLAAGMALFVENLTAHGHLPIDEETRGLLLEMSPATIGRLLAGEHNRYVSMTSLIPGALLWEAGSPSRRAWTLPPSPLVQGEECFPWISLVPWPWTWWVMMESEQWEISTGP